MGDKSETCPSGWRQVNRPLSEKHWGCILVSCLCCALKLVAGQILSVITPWYSWTHVPLASIQGVVSKIGAPDVKTVALTMWTSSLVGDTDSLEHGRARMWRWSLKDYGQPLDLCLIRSLPLGLQLWRLTNRPLIETVGSSVFVSSLLCSGVVALCELFFICNSPVRIMNVSTSLHQRQEM